MTQMPTKGVPEAAWGGIGGSGKHAGEAIAELASQPQIREMFRRMPEVAWGGIGGSGKHPAQLMPEEGQQYR